VVGARVAIDQDGRIFVAVAHLTDDFDEYVVVYRSTNAGTGFQFWGQLGSIGGDEARLSDLDVATGATPRVFVTTMVPGGSGFAVRVAAADPTAASASWSITTPLSSGASFLNPQLDIDHRSFDPYYIYLVCGGLDGNGDDIWFTRSVDQGASWATPYRIAELTTSGNLMYSRPRVSYGAGGIVHVAWTYTERIQDTFDDALRYRRAVDYAGSAADWQAGPVAITLTSDGADDNVSDLVASLDDPAVLLAYSSWFNGEGSQIRYSADAGASWPTGNYYDLPWDGGRFAYQRPTGEFIGLLNFWDGVERAAISRAPTDALTSWSSPQTFTDLATSSVGARGLALDPSRAEQVAILANDGSYGSYEVYFDAEWRGEPGIPNLDHGTPLALAAAAASPPVLADLDGDGDQEILFGDMADHIQAFHHDGTPVAGWPVAVPQLSATPVVVAPLNFTTLSVIAGADDGRVHAFSATGAPQPGWPYQMPATGPTYVSVGALGGPYLHTVVAGTDNRIEFINYAGNAPLDTFGWILFGRSVTSPAAIGDIDCDGINEAVFGAGDRVLAYELYSDQSQLNVLLPSAVSSMVSLADLDFDGCVEVIAPTAGGQLYVLDGATGATWPGFPFTTPSGTELTSAAVANILGNAAPEIAVSARQWTTHVIYADGNQQGGYPVTPGDGWLALASPIMGRVDGSSPDVVCVSRGGDVWAFDNFGATIGGWPQPVRLPNQFQLTPAMGDIDQDGRNEVVAVDDDLVIIDVGSTPTSATSTWAMFGHDARRSGCADCPEFVATPVEPDQPLAVTRVSFAGAAPNPVAGPSTEFRFAVPVRSFAQLEVYDVRGRRVRSLLRSEVPVGDHAVTWDGRDAEGRPVSSGQYLARLQVRGPGLTEELTRAVVVLR